MTLIFFQHDFSLTLLFHSGLGTGSGGDTKINYRRIEHTIGTKTWLKKLSPKQNKTKAKHQCNSNYEIKSLLRFLSCFVLI